ncbi:MAG: Rrf2 family transcriptional regulator [Chloroflexi bacterium]|nr:Rrf2 family transcriptional regulator [Chloroflexota bacterium]
MLALAGAFGKGPVPLTQIAQQEKISLAYLEQPVAVLKRSGLVESVRGARGGYRLAFPPDQVTLGDVLRAAEEFIGPTDCAVSGRQSGCCERESACSVRPAWERLRETMVSVLDSTTLADLCQPLPMG